MPSRNVVPFSVALILAVILLFPMTVMFRGSPDLGTTVEQLQIDWLRMTLDVESVSMEEFRRFQQRVADTRLTDLSRFSEDLAEALQRLPSAIEATGVTLNEPAGVESAREWVETVDRLLTVVRDEAGLLDDQRAAAYNSLFVFSLTAAIVVAGLLIYQMQRMRYLVAAKDDSERVAALERRVRENERRRLARELHDGAAQELAIARMLLDRVETSEVSTALRGAIQSAGDEIRLLYRAMDPRFTEPAELESMLHELGASIEHRSGQQFHIQIDGISRASWSPETQLHLFRIAQEAMHNVVRHARASWASLTLALINGKSILLRVEDDGVGLAGTEESYGRRGMRERMELIGGTIEWRPRDGGGTCVEVIAPLDGAEGRIP